MTYISAVGIIDAKHLQTDMSETMRTAYAISIISTVAKFYDVTIDQLKGRNRNGDIVRAAKIASYLIKKRIPTMSLKQCANLFGQRYQTLGHADHSAIIYNNKVVAGWVKVGDSIAQDIEVLSKLI